MLLTSLTAYSEQNIIIETNRTFKQDMIVIIFCKLPPTNAVEVVAIPFTTLNKLQLRMLPSFLFSRCFRMSTTWTLQCRVTVEICHEVNVMITKLSKR